MGYSGQQQRFTIECDDRGTERPPTAATCFFNTLKLPPYASAQTLAAKVRLSQFLGRGLSRGRCCCVSGLVPWLVVAVVVELEVDRDSESV